MKIRNCACTSVRAGTGRAFVFFSGGTGGHLTPALAVAQALDGFIAGGHSRSVFFTGARRGERPLRGNNGYTFHELPLLKPRRVPLRFLAQSIVRFEGLTRYLHAHRPAVCFGLGGYLSLPGVLAARSCGVPVVLLEQNRIPGRVNRLMAPFAACVCTSYPQSGRTLRSRHVVYTGNPVRRAFVRRRVDPRQRPARAWRKVAVLGGSQGANRLNRVLLDALPELTAERASLRFVHAAGSDCADVSLGYRRLGFSAEVAPFFPDIAERISDADVAVCRAGGSTLAELLVLGVPALLVPYPGSKDGHQLANARFVSDQGAGVLCAQESFDGPAVVRYLRDVVCDGAGWKARAQAAYRLGRPTAARTVAAIGLGFVAGSARGGLR